MDEFTDIEDNLSLEELTAQLTTDLRDVTVLLSERLSAIPDGIRRFFHADNFEFTDFNFISLQRSKAIGYADLKERAESLFQQAMTIVIEKGYRFKPSLYTAREHKEIGSSGYGKFMVMPDTIVRIANRTLNILTGSEAEQMTVEEIRRARILYGMSTIDDTGTVTGEVVSIPDSYHFLQEERKGEIKRLEQQILLGLRDITTESFVRHVPNFAAYLKLIRTLAEGHVTTEAVLEHFENMHTPPDVPQNLGRYIETAKNMAYKNGYRDKILTPMEMLFLGKSVEDRHMAKPYTPLGVQDGTIGKVEANKIRNGEKHFSAETDIFTSYAYPFIFTLEPLNKEGATGRGPLVLDRETKEPLEQRAIDFYRDKMPKPIPFARKTDWYFKPAA